MTQPARVVAVRERHRRLGTGAHALRAALPWLPSRFALFKYTLYALLFVDCMWFMHEDFSSAPYLFAGGLAWANVGTSLAQSIDTWAWLALLVLFELETSVFAPAALTGLRKWSLHLSRAVCYVFVVYACWGYVEKALLFRAAVPLSPATDLCALAGSGTAYVHHLDDYVAIVADNCARLATAPGLVRLAESDMVATAGTVVAARWLAWTDVVNAAAWIAVVIVLEIELWIKLVMRHRRRPQRLVFALKSALYATLGGAALYWGIAGTFVDFWDAMLWIAAFVFIEMNIFRWGEAGTSAATPAASVARA